MKILALFLIFVLTSCTIVKTNSEIKKDRLALRYLIKRGIALNYKPNCSTLNHEIASKIELFIKEANYELYKDLRRLATKAIELGCECTD